MDVLHLDDQLLVVNKPPGVLSQADHTGDPDVVRLGRRHLADDETTEPFLGLVHRLDRPASGVMILARTPSAARTLSAQFRERTAEKQYLVLTEGTLGGVGTWTDFIAKPNRQPRIVAPDHPGGKRAELQWQALVTQPDRSLLLIELRTGRPHQIRLQAAERGHPVVGDRRYGAQTSIGERVIALHHAVLRVDPPHQVRRYTFVAPPPEVWQEEVTTAVREAVSRVLDRARPS